MLFDLRSTGTGKGNIYPNAPSNSQPLSALALNGLEQERTEQASRVTFCE